MIGDGPAELVGTSQRAARADHRHRQNDVLPDRNLFVQAAAGLLLWAIKIPVAVIILRLMDVIPQ